MIKLMRSTFYKEAGTKKKLTDFTFKENGKIEFARPLNKGTLTVTYTSRIDLDKPQVIDRSVQAKAFKLGKSWQIVYLEEKPTGPISAHDTAAMSPQTEVEVLICKAEEFQYSADSYILAMISPEGKINQYIDVR